jgi:hypothetical protein
VTASRVRVAAVLVLSIAACRAESHPGPTGGVEPPLTSPAAIPEAPVSGTIGGAPFVARSARYVADRRVGYQRTDIQLSAGAAESACGPVVPANAPSVWIRLEGSAAIEAQELRPGPGAGGPWSVHYQVFGEDGWVGVGNGSAILSVRELGLDGRVRGGLAVCFPDAAKSCVSGSFVAPSCPPRIDQAVRGAMAPEEIPAKYLQPMRDAALPQGMSDAADAPR